MKTQNKMITLRLTEEERRVLKMRAGNAQMSLNQYLRWLAGLPHAAGEYDKQAQVTTLDMGGEIDEDKAVAILEAEVTHGT
jgi:hypothetical protein